MSRSSLCLIEGRPPQGQFNACSTEKLLPLTQVVGRPGRHPKCKQRASRKAPLWSAKPCSVMGKAESQLEAPFSLGSTYDAQICRATKARASLRSAEADLKEVQRGFQAGASKT